MALTILTAPGRIGPGMWVFVNQSTIGPIPVDDWIFVEVRPVGGANIVRGTALMRGLHTVNVPLGIYEHTVAPLFIDAGLADGAAMTVQASQFHASGSFVDNTGAVAGWSWDPTSALWTLVAGGSDVQKILDAVIRIFPSN